MSTLSKWNLFHDPSTWDPFRELEEMQNRLSSFFGRRVPLLKGSGDGEEFTLTTRAPRVDITEDEKEYVIDAELPGVKKEDVKVSIENGVLSISGERKSEKEEKGKKYHRVEQTYGTFMRSFTLPEGSSGEKISAEFRDGILKVRLPKDEKGKSESDRS
jgi:HSP20 family protein